MRNLLTAINASGVEESTIEFEHVAVNYYGHMSILLNELIDHQQFKHHGRALPDCAFLSRDDMQIELIPPHVVAHQGWRLQTESDFASLRGALMLDPNFEQLMEYSIRDGDRMMASMFRHIQSEVCVQIVWRKEDLFPSKE